MGASVQLAIQNNLNASIRDIALNLCAATSAKACYLTLRERPGAYPRFIGAVSVQGDPPDWNDNMGYMPVVQAKHINGAQS